MIKNIKHKMIKFNHFMTLYINKRNNLFKKGSQIV